MMPLLSQPHSVCFCPSGLQPSPEEAPVQRHRHRPRQGEHHRRQLAQGLGPQAQTQSGRLQPPAGQTLPTAMHLRWAHWARDQAKRQSGAARTGSVSCGGVPHQREKVRENGWPSKLVYDTNRFVFKSQPQRRTVIGPWFLALECRILKMEFQSVSILYQLSMIPQSLH